MSRMNAPLSALSVKIMESVSRAVVSGRCRPAIACPLGTLRRPGHGRHGSIDLLKWHGHRRLEPGSRPSDYDPTRGAIGAGVASQIRSTHCDVAGVALPSAAMTGLLRPLRKGDVVE